MHISVLIENPVHLPELLPFEYIESFYLSAETCGSEAVRRVKDSGRKAYYALPYVERMKDREMRMLGDGDGFLIRSIDQLGQIRALGLPGRRILDQGLYCWNTEAAVLFRELGADVLTAPYELSKKDLAPVMESGILPVEQVVYGYYPAMVSRQCLLLNTESCAKGSSPYSVSELKDRTGAKFHVVNHCKGCYNVIYNTVPTLLPDTDLTDRIRLSFSVEPVGRPAEILDCIVHGGAWTFGDYTRGRYKKSAE